MTGPVLSEFRTVTRPRDDENGPVPPSDGTDGERERIDLRADRRWIARIRRQAARMGISASAYIRQATTRQLEKDEADDPGD